MKNLFLGLMAFFLVLAGAGLLVHHHFTDYDFSAVLRNPKLILAKAKAPQSMPLTQIHHVFVIVEENHNWSDIYKNPEAPFINNILLPQGGFAANYHNISPEMGNLHPSEPNYILIEGGKVAFPDHTFTSDELPGKGNSTASHDHLVYQLEQNNLSWKSYQEDISGVGCPISAAGNYAPKHNPFIFFQDTAVGCQNHIRPITELQDDLTSGNPANYVFISPNLQNDMHSGSVKQADSWLAQTVPSIINSSVFKKDGVLFITWDEGSGDADENNPIGLIIVSPLGKANYANSIAYSHPSLTKTIQEIFNLTPLLGMAGDQKTTDLTDFFKF